MNNLAVVIPFFKKFALEECLESLSSQTDKRFNLYIGNDNSPEDPEEIIQKYPQLLNIDYFKFSDNLGSKSLVNHWSRCIKRVGEEQWLMILGDDDKLENNCVKEFYNHLREIEELKINVVRFASVVINRASDKISGPHLHPKIENSTDFFMRRFTGNSRSSLSEYVFKKDNFLKKGFKDLPLAWYADLLAVMEISEFRNIYSINSAVVFFRSSGLNISSKTDNLKEKNIATFGFFHYLLKEKSEYFNPEQKRFLQDKLEKTFLDNKKNGKFWLELSRLYISNMELKRLLMFLGKFSKTILSKFFN